MAKYKLKDRVLIPAEIVEIHEDEEGVWYRIEPMNCEPAWDDTWDNWSSTKFDMSENCIAGEYEEF